MVDLLDFDQILTRLFYSNRLIVHLTVDFDIPLFSLLKVSLN